MRMRWIAAVAMVAGALGFAGCASAPASAPVATAPAAAPAQASAPPAVASATTPARPFEPVVGQAGKDVVWVPTSEALIERMLNLAKLTPADYVIDLGSGDGRNIIAAAKRGARGHGVEFNPEMVALAQKLAREAGVADRATFIQGDMYEADISKANRFRDELGSTPWTIGADGTVSPNETPGIGVEIDEAFLKANPPIEGPGYV